MKLYPLVEKFLIVDDPETTVVLLLLLLRILWLGCWVRFTDLQLVLPGEAGVPVQSGAEVEGVGEGAGDDVEGGGPCGVWVTCGMRRSCAGF